MKKTVFKTVIFAGILLVANVYAAENAKKYALSVEDAVKIAKENNVKKIVVGIPLNMDGTKGFQAENCENFASKIQGYEIIKEDERLTSDTAEENLRNKKIDFRKDKGLVDIESACIILEQYLARNGK